MRIIEDLNIPANIGRPCAVTIGSFDGVHKGHQSLITKMRNLVGDQGVTCLVTFKNHPSHVLPNWTAVELILETTEKLKWLEHYGVDAVYCIPFTLELAAMDYKTFIKKLFLACPFDHLVLGKDAHLGNRRGGTPQRVSELCTSLGACAHYLSKITTGDKDISSSHIRSLLTNQLTDKAEELLGHPLKAD